MSQDTIERFALEAMASLQESLADKWDLVTDDQKKAAARAARRVIELEFEKKQLQVSGASAAEIAANNDDLEFVKVTVSEFTVAAEVATASAFQEAFWTGVNKALEALGSFLAGAGKGLIPGL